MTVDEIIKLLDLKPHPEGGYFNEIFRSRETVGLASLPDRYHDEATKRTFSRESLEWQVPPDFQGQVQARSRTQERALSDESGSKSNQAGADQPQARQSKTQTQTHDDWRPMDVSLPGSGLVPSELAGGFAASGLLDAGNRFSPHERAWCTSIYYLITADSSSVIHKLKGDEIYHFYLGDPVEMLNIYPDGTTEVLRLGRDIASGERLQHVVPHDVWQGSCVIEGGKFALLGCTVSPGFVMKDYVEGDRSRLIFRYPEHAKLIEKLTRPD